MDTTGGLRSTRMDFTWNYVVGVASRCHYSIGQGRSWRYRRWGEMALMALICYTDSFTLHGVYIRVCFRWCIEQSIAWVGFGVYFVCYLAFSN